MEFIAYGVDFAHTRGEFCKRYETPVYFFSHFRTDYRIEMNGQLIDGKAGDMLINRPGDVIYHGAATDDGEGFRNDWLYVDGEPLSDLLAKYPLPVGIPFHVDGLYLASAIKKIHKEKSYSLDGYAEKCDMLICDAIINIYREYKSGGVSSIAQLEHARGEMLHDFQKPWTLDEIASMSGYSKSRFCALYKEKYGVSPINELISHRVEHARLLLQYGNMTVSQVSFACGFSSIYYFSRHFKQIVGISPSEYKNNIYKSY